MKCSLFAPKGLLVIALAFLLLLGPSSQWHAFGHLTVARIAQYHLENEKDPAFQDVLNWANSLLEPFKEYCGEEKYPFTECATWPDKIRSGGWNSMFNWHFKDSPVYASGFAPKAPLPDINPENAAWAINDSVSTLASAHPDPQGHSKQILGKSLSLRNLIHFVGDIHQPLHGCSRYSDAHPDGNGDQGGNLFSILHYDYNPTWNNLHFIWDHMFDLDRGFDSPLNQQQYQEVSDYALELIRIYEDDKHFQMQIELNNTPDRWAFESYQISNSVVYKGIIEGQYIPQWYIDQGKDIVQKRIALAGRRLADIIKLAYKQLQENAQVVQTTIQ